MHDLVIRGGTVVDGTGGPARVADVAISDGLVVAIGADVGAGRRTLDADGALVLGAHFDPWDLCAYAVGIVAAVGWERRTRA